VIAAADIEPFFLRVDKGRRFCILHRPRHANGRVMLHVAPFAEEMNRSRRMSALTARALAGDGWTVLQMDLYGCGDSDGELQDADWPTWVADIVQAAQWLRDRHGRTPTLWGVRAGCLLACDAARALPEPCALLMWQPVASGARHLQQFRRIEAAAEAFREGSASGKTMADEDLRATSGATVDVAGYRLTPALATGLASSTLQAPPRASRLGLIQVGSTAEIDAAALDAWRRAGWCVAAATIPGPPFWRMQGCADVPTLVEATVAMASESA